MPTTSPARTTSTPCSREARSRIALSGGAPQPSSPAREAARFAPLFSKADLSLTSDPASLNVSRTGRGVMTDGLITGEDGLTRCWWPGTDPLYVGYHDTEWGRPVADDRRLFEKLCLEGSSRAFPGSPSCASARISGGPSRVSTSTPSPASATARSRHWSPTPASSAMPARSAPSSTTPAEQGPFRTKPLHRRLRLALRAGNRPPAPRGSTRPAWPVSARRPNRRRSPRRS